ncbi:hypothetical protein NCC49_000263 [Naganishia albida]|nr:hypothetical protein NCC49_000263 [Naganishia albida]
MRRHNIRDTIPHVIASLFPSFKTTPVLWLLVNRKFVVFLATVCVSYPLSLYRDIGKLSRASGMALVSMFVIVFSVLVRGPGVDPSLRGSDENVFSVIQPRVFEAIGVISFAYVCHHNSLLIYGSLHTPTLDRFNTVTHVSTLLSLICCLIMSVAGYLSFTDKTEGNILNNFPATDTLINVARLCFGLNMFTTSPLEAFVCREVIETLYYPDKPFSYRRHVIVTTVLTFSTMLVSMTTCDLGIVLEITGGLSATALAYLFPAMAYYKLCTGPWYSRQKLPAAACTVFGVVVMFLSLVLALKKMWNGEGGAGKVCE